MKNRKKLTHEGFTLVELLVAIAIIATLAAISASAVVRFRKSADKTLALGNLRQLQTANVSYSSDHNGRFVPPKEKIDGVLWYVNPELISQLKGDQATYSSSGGTPDTTLPISMMDPAVVRTKSAGYEKLSGSYAYTRTLEQDPVVISRLKDAARSAAFITADGDGFVDHTNQSKIAYRHADKAVVVYYGGHAAILNRGNMSRIDSNGGASNIFWAPTE